MASTLPISADGPDTENEYGVLFPPTPPGKTASAPGTTGGTTLSSLTSGPTLRHQYGQGNAVALPMTMGPSIYADPFTFVGPSPMAGQMPIPTLSCPPIF